jgi:hypothetical protein
MLDEQTVYQSAVNGDQTAAVLKQHLLVSNFMQATGCNTEQATQLLQDARWDFEVSSLCHAPTQPVQMALSMFFQETTIPNAAAQQRQGINPVSVVHSTTNTLRVSNYTSHLFPSPDIQV